MIWHPSESDLALAGSGDLPAWKRPLVLGHLRKCAACAQTAEEYSGVPAELRELAQAAPPEPPWLAARIVALAAPFSAASPRLMPAGAARLKPAAAIAATLALIVLALLLLGRGAPVPPTNYQASATPEAVIGETIGPDGRQRVIFYTGRKGGPVNVSADGGAIDISHADPNTGAVTITRIRMGD